MPQNKMGRPKVDSPKDIKFSIRLDKEYNEKLISYCEEKSISKGEAIRKGIDLLVNQK